MRPTKQMLALLSQLETGLFDRSSVTVHLSDSNLELWRDLDFEFLSYLNMQYNDYHHTATVDEDDNLTVTATCLSVYWSANIDEEETDED